MPVKPRTCQSVQGMLAVEGMGDERHAVVAVDLVDRFLGLGREDVAGNAVAGRGQVAGVEREFRGADEQRVVAPGGGGRRLQVGAAVVGEDDEIQVLAAGRPGRSPRCCPSRRKNANGREKRLFYRRTAGGGC